MFYEGDLQSGIALAVSEGKHVLCFVRDDGEESSKWQDRYLADEETSQLISSTSVLLRLEGGSQEAGFLASFCPINSVPLVVAIKNGQLQEYMTSGVEEEEFKRRIKAVLQAPSTSGPPPQQQADQNTTATTPPSQANVSTPTTNAPDESGVIEQSATEQARRDGIRAGKRRAEDTTEATPQEPDTSKTPQNEWKTVQRKREQHQKSERERVLSQIKQDHEDRKQREEQRRLATAELQRQSKNAQNAADQQAQQRKQASDQFRLQVRLFDGTSIRSTFHPTQTVSKDVRSWIDSRRSDGDTPYTLKHILNPLPNRTLSISEEDQTLAELGLGPTASLVMVPVQSYTEAYAAAGSYMPIRGLYAGYNLVTGVVGSVAGTVGSYLGFGQTAGTQAPNTTSDTSSQPDGSVAEATRRASPRNPRSGQANVRTLFDGASDQPPNQFYNGNQLNFEPRNNEDDDK